MARYTATVKTPRTPDEAFAVLSDFSTTQDWDPGVAEASRLDDGPITMGSRFRVVAEFLSRRVELIYEVIAIDAPRAITLRGENATVISLDTIEFVPSPNGTGTSVIYDADLALKGPLQQLLDVPLRVAFGRIGDRAVEGLRTYLA